MGMYLNPGSSNFQESLNSEIYVDKTGLIALTNQKINTQQKNICVSRPRRFGKTMAADMLAAYYGCSENTASLFDACEIKKDKSYKEHLNQYHVIKLDMQSFLTGVSSVAEMVENLSKELIQELMYFFPDAVYLNTEKLQRVLESIFTATGRKFVILIDEWDCVMRCIHDAEEQKLYLKYLRDWIKNQPYVALAYMTGILPIKKYGEHSVLNMFDEYSMTQSYQLVPYFGFTEEEVKLLCERFDMDFDEAKEWYDGYRFVKGSGAKQTAYSMYSPRSVVSAMLNECFDTYWTQTETYEALKEYIQKNYKGLKDAVVEMLAGNSVKINIRHFQNDMNTFHDKDDVLTLLVHLGYLSYDPQKKTVSIPNKEVAQEFVASIEEIEAYGEVFHSIQESRELLEALWNEDGEAVAAGVEKAHQHFPAIKYNNENALRCVIELAFYYAQEYYTIIRELPTGKGFADICLIPKPDQADKPAVIIELKWDKSAETAIDQIKRKDYPDVLKAYHGNLLLCGINYDKDKAEENKRHQCRIERFMK